MSARLNRKGVFILTMWNSIVSTGITMLIKPINEVDLMPNYMLMVPLVLLFSITLVISFRARNWSYLAIERCEAFVSIIMLINLAEIYREIVLYAKELKSIGVIVVLSIVDIA